jgi:hypothetical protein
VAVRDCVEASPVRVTSTRLSPVTEDTRHSAAGSALGYLYQCYLPLLQMAERAGREPGLTVALELLDDVQFEEHGRPKELVQSKHRIDSRGDLSDTSVDLWRTINVWISALDQFGPDETPALTLVTTAHAPADSAAHDLRADERDEERALGRLETAARTSLNAQTAPWRKRFSRLAAPQRAGLVRAITVADGALSIAKLDDELKRVLFWALPRTAEAETFLDYVKGWWLGIAIKLLRRELPAFPVTDMLSAIQDVRDQFGPENLPTDLDLPNLDETTAAGFEEHVFVRQLELIALTQRQLAIAIRDYYRAFTQRSRWLRRELLGVGELDRFERKLVEEWEFVFANLTAELPGGAEELEKQRCGRDVLAHLAENARARIRARYEEPFVTRGTLHSLADERRIGWHPEFEKRLEALLRPVVET